LVDNRNFLRTHRILRAEATSTDDGDSHGSKECIAYDIHVLGSLMIASVRLTLGNEVIERRALRSRFLPSFHFFGGSDDGSPRDFEAPNELSIAKQTLKARQDSVDLTRRLESGGSVPLADLRQAEELEYAASVQVPQLEQQIQQEENALRLLLGQNPGPITHSDANALAPVPQDLPVGLPTRLLERRPDFSTIFDPDSRLISMA
jgi:hypothetical protein